MKELHSDYTAPITDICISFDDCVKHNLYYQAMVLCSEVRRRKGNWPEHQYEFIKEHGNAALETIGGETERKVEEFHKIF